MRWIYFLFFVFGWSGVYGQSLHIIQCQFPPQWNGKSARIAYSSPDGQLFIDTTTIQSQQAFFEVNLSEPAPISLWVEDQPEDTHLFLDTPRIDIVFPDTTTLVPEVTGSSASGIWNTFRQAQAVKTRQLTDLNLEVQEAQRKGDLAKAKHYQNEADSIQRASVGQLESLIRDNLSAPLSWYLFSTSYPLFSYQIALRLLTDLGSFSHLPSYARVQTRFRQKELGRPAPDFTLPGSRGEPVTLSKQKHKWILLYFHFITQPNLPEEQDELLQLYERYRQNDLEVISVCIGLGTIDFMQSIREQAVPWTQVLAEHEAYENLSSAYAVERLPDTVLIDSKGRIVARDCSWAELETILKSNK